MEPLRRLSTEEPGDPPSPQPSSPTSELYALCGESNWDPHPDLVEALVLAGADVLQPKSMALHTLIVHSRVAAVEACLRTPRRLDFTTRCTVRKENPLQLACHGCIADADSVAMLRAMVLRIETHPEDRVEWDQTDDLGRDVLHLAAQYQKLSLVWPLLSQMPYFSDQVEPIPLDYATVWKVDWDRFDTVTQASFAIARAQFIAMDAPTARLCQLSLQADCSPPAVQECVEQGADVMAHRPAAGYSILHNFLFEGSVACVKALLRTSKPLDFTQRGVCGRTLLHGICSNVNATAGEACSLLHAVIDRLEHHPEDRVDWGLRDKLGRDFIALAAERKMLSLMWSVLKGRGVAYFVHRESPLPVSSLVYQPDWDQMGPEDHAQLAPLGLFY